MGFKSELTVLLLKAKGCTTRITTSFIFFSYLSLADLKSRPRHGLFPANPLLTTLVSDTSSRPFYPSLILTLNIVLRFR